MMNEVTEVTPIQETFSLQQLIQELLERQRPLIQQRGLGVELLLSYELPDFAVGNREAIGLMLSGMTEAVVANTTNRTIGVGAVVLEQNEHQVLVRITVSDAGTGSSSETPCLLGAGSGPVPGWLKTFDRYAEQLGAVLKGHEAGKNHCCCLELPLSLETDDSAVDEEDLCPLICHVPGFTVLVAEDNAINQRTLETILQKLGFSVLCANNGDEAVAVWRSGKVDLILMDIHMPVMDGIEALKTIRAASSEAGAAKLPPIVALTADALSGTEAQLLGEGFDLYINKPITICELTEKLRRFL